VEVQFYETPRGHSPVAEFLDALSTKAAAKRTIVIGWLATGEIEHHRNVREHLLGDIWELKVRHDGEQYRFLYAVQAGTAWLLVPIHKKTQKVRDSDIRTAQARLGELRQRGNIP
jgi:phage-related protein